jgi:hypothetical protein
MAMKNEAAPAGYPARILLLLHVLRTQWDGTLDLVRLEGSVGGVESDG